LRIKKEHYIRLCERFTLLCCPRRVLIKCRAMTYRQRLTLAAACSVAVHLIVLAPGGCRAKPRSLALSRNDPIVLELQPEPAVPPTQQFVDAPVAANEPVGQTHRIAERSSRAADKVEGGEEGGAPRVEKPTGFDRIAAPAPAPPATPPPEKPRVREPVQPPDLRREQVAAATLDKVEAELMLRDEQEDAEAENGPAPEQTAAPPPELAPQIATGRVQSGVKRTGLMAFEAMESEIAPYLKEVRQRVERNWRTALHMRYSGTSPTRAVLDCAIAPDGHIISVVIVEAGDSATFAPLCKEAIENAGPFGPFPFEVPDVYRSRNLEIRWTFSFLE